jgi:hypothetical protein
MDKQSLFFTTIVAIVAISLMLMAIQFLAKKMKIKPETEEKSNLTYSIWFGSLLISFILFLKVALELVENSIELLIADKTIDNTFIAVMEKIAIFTGFTFVSTFLAYYIVNTILKYLIGNLTDSIEMEKGNTGYFIIKGIVLLSLVFSIITVFEHFLRWFAPSVATPFYH